MKRVCFWALMGVLAVLPFSVVRHTRTAGFVLEPDEYSYMNISVLRRREPDNDYNNLTYDIRETVDDGNDYDDESYRYGSYVYKLNGGATKCPWEGPEESIFYEQGGRPALISDGTLQLENPKLDILNHEVSDVPRDQPAIINIRMTQNAVPRHRCRLRNIGRRPARCVCRRTMSWCHRTRSERVLHLHQPTRPIIAHHPPVLVCAVPQPLRSTRSLSLLQ